MESINARIAYRIDKFITNYYRKYDMVPEYEYVSRKLNIQYKIVYSYMCDMDIVPDGPLPVDGFMR